MPLRVVQVLPSLDIGGAEVLVSQLVQELLDRGVDAHLLLLTAPGARYPAVEAALQGRVHVIGKASRYDARVLLRAARWLRRRRPHVVHTHLFTAKAWGVAAARLARVPVVVHTQHGSHIETARHLLAVHRVMGRALDAMVAVSPTVVELIGQHGMARRTVEIPNGIPLRGPVADPGAPGPLRVGTLGRLHPLKGHVYLIEAMARVRERGVDARLLLLGDGEERGRLEARVRELELGDRVTFAGVVDDAPERLVGLHLLAQPSLSEGLPLAVLEAGAAGLPLLLTRVGGMPGLIDGGAGGWLVPPRDPEALADAIVEMAGLAPGARRELGQRSRQRIERDYSLAAMAARYTELYGELLAERGIAVGR